LAENLAVAILKIPGESAGRVRMLKRRSENDNPIQSSRNWKEQGRSAVFVPANQMRAAILAQT
jgi:hypothetical protein